MCQLLDVEKTKKRSVSIEEKNCWSDNEANV